MGEDGGRNRRTVLNVGEPITRLSVSGYMIELLKKAGCIVHSFTVSDFVLPHASIERPQELYSRSVKFCCVTNIHL